MPFSDLMKKIRQWDNFCARWMMRHFYMLFFECVLAIVFFFFIFTIFRTLDLAASASRDNIYEQALTQQMILSLIIIFLMLLNSFWMLFMFSGINRIRILLRDLGYHLSRRKPH